MRPINFQKSLLNIKDTGYYCVHLYWTQGRIHAFREGVPDLVTRSELLSGPVRESWGGPRFQIGLKVEFKVVLGVSTEFSQIGMVNNFFFFRIFVIATGIGFGSDSLHNETLHEQYSDYDMDADPTIYIWIQPCSEFESGSTTVLVSMTLEVP